MSTSRFLIFGWSGNPIVFMLCAAALTAHVASFGLKRRLVWLMAAVGVALLALVSPLDALADGYLFSAHMAQHILLLLIVPALAWLSLPPTFSVTVLPRFFRHPIVGWVAGVGAMWFWHAPTLCNAAVSSAIVHGLQTLSLLVLGAIFWVRILAPREEERLSPPAAVSYLFSACVTCSILGIMIAFSPVTVCSVYTMPSVDRWGMLSTIRGQWGMTPERDQQIGGLLMWVPMCLIYLTAIFAQVARWFAEPANPVPEKMG